MTRNQHYIKLYNNKHSKISKVLKHLMANMSLSPMDAFHSMNNTRLAATIHKLRRAGFIIDDANGGQPYSIYFMSYENLAQYRLEYEQLCEQLKREKL